MVEANTAGRRRTRLQKWPTESELKLPDRSRCRQPEPVEAVYGRMDSVNVRLRGMREKELVKEEVVAGRLYTGPRACSRLDPGIWGVAPSAPAARGGSEP